MVAKRRARGSIDRRLERIDALLGEVSISYREDSKMYPAIDGGVGAMDTKLLHLSQVTIQSGLPESLTNPIKPELFVGKHEARLGALVGVTQFGVNHVTLEPGSISALRHWHEAEDEFVYVLSGELTLIDDNGEHALEKGSFAGFPAGSPNAHHLENKSKEPASFMVVGSRKPGADTVHYPDDDLGPVRK